MWEGLTAVFWALTTSMSLMIDRARAYVGEAYCCCPGTEYVTVS